ncbi:hypothetical protein [Teichococcus aestuarii]|uniref:hypothetical protein n=1 Tax=Teichococcus aestuarii TaxID=568898 RepID=UPI00361E44D9
MPDDLRIAGGRVLDEAEGADIHRQARGIQHPLAALEAAGQEFPEADAHEQDGALILAEARLRARCDGQVAGQMPEGTAAGIRPRHDLEHQPGLGKVGGGADELPEGLTQARPLQIGARILQQGDPGLIRRIRGSGSRCFLRRSRGAAQGAWGGAGRGRCCRRAGPGQPGAGPCPAGMRRKGCARSP